MQINVTYDSSVSSAPAGFTTAVDAAVAYYEDNFDAPVTVNITIGWGTAAGVQLPSGALGATVPEGYLFNYQEVRNALWADARSPDALTAAESLPAADPTGGGTFFVTSAEAKALGLLSANNSGTDGTIVIDPNANYTFDPNNRDVAGEVDLIGVLEHEIGHVLGRVSDLGVARPNGSTLYGALDLFRYSSPGVLAPTATNASFSIDGQNLLLPFNDPSNGGDSDDWSINNTGDAYDAFAGTGELLQISQADLTMLDVFGFHPASDQPNTPGPGNGTIGLVDQNGATITFNVSANNDRLSQNTLYGYELQPQLGPLTNNGTVTSIAASGDSAAFYVGTYNAVGYDVFTNSSTGIIMAQAVASGAMSYGFYYGTFAPHIANAGLIQSVSSQGTAFGIESYSPSDAFSNSASGILRVWGEQEAVGIFYHDTGELDNAGLIDVTSDHLAVGVVGITTFDNSGTIEATSLQDAGTSVAVELYQTAPSSFTNTGTIIGDYAVYVNQQSTSPSFEPDVDIVNSGTMIGAILLANGVNQIHNTGIIGGNIYFGDSAATYDGAHGHLYGDIYLGYGVNTVTLSNDGDTVYGGGDSDTITGGAGNDTFMIARGTNHLDGGGGFNTLSLQSAARGYTVDLGAGTAVGAGTTTIANIQEVIGSSFADTLIAGNSAATLVAGGGADVLRGGAGNDTLVAGPGGDTITGGGGNNTFVYSAGDGQIVITDFGANGDQDVLNIYGYSSAASVQQQGADTLITLSGSDQILLKNVQASAVSGGAVTYSDADYSPQLSSSPLAVFGTTPINLDYALTVYAGEQIAMDFGSQAGEHDGLTLAEFSTAPNLSISFDNFGTASFQAAGGTVYGASGLAQNEHRGPDGTFANEAGASYVVTNSAGDAAGIHGWFSSIVNAGLFSVSASGATSEVDGINSDAAFQANIDNTASGTLTVQSDNSAAGITVNGGGPIRNDGLINVSGVGTVYGIFENDYGLGWPDTGPEITNNGRIQVAGTAGSTVYGIAIAGNDQVPAAPLLNTGTISAPIAIGNVDTGLSDHASQSIILTNSGIIDGDIDLTGMSSQIINSGGTINGNILLQDDFDFPSLRAAMGGTGGDTVDLRGGSFTGDITVSAGQAGDVDDHYILYTGTADTIVTFTGGQSQMTAAVHVDTGGHVTVAYDMASNGAGWVTNSDGSVTVTAGDHGTETLYNVVALQFTDQTVRLMNTPPVVSTSNIVAQRNQTLALSSLFSVSDADGDTMTKYELWDGTSDPNSGHFVVNGVAQPSNTIIDITAAQLAQTSFVTGKVGDSLQIRAYDGIAWSAADNAPWSPFTITVPDAAPVVTTSNVSEPHLTTIALSSLFSVSDADGDAITQYQLWDGTRDPNSGHFVVNGVAQAAGTVITISAAQLSQTSFVTGSVGDSLQIRASDGILWSAADNASWSPFTISVPANHAPVVTTANVTEPHLTTIALSSLFSVSDADGDAMTQYQLWDGTRDPNSGHFVVNGVAQAAGTVITISAAQLAQTSFVTGSVGDSLQIRANDGITWSAADNANWSPFTITVPPNSPPVVTTTSTRLAANQTAALSSLFSVSDADSDTMTQYQLWDSTRDPNSGHFVVNGVAQPAGTVITISAAQLSQTSFVAGSVNNDLQIRAFDGLAWSAADNASWAPFTVGPLVNHAPVVTTGPLTIARNQTVALSSLFTVSDADGDAMTQYQLWDSTRDPNSGYFVVNGVAQAAGTVITISAAQLAQTSFVTGKLGDSLQIRAFDGLAWSAADTASWSPFTITVPDAAPVVTTANVSEPHLTTIPLTSLFSVSDADGDAMTQYQLWDSTRDPNSGYFVVNGVAQAAGTVITISAAQLSQTSFVTGSVGDNLQIRASDGIEWSAADNANWSPFTVTVPPDNAPVVTTQTVNAMHGRTLALSSLFSVSDADGDTMTQYQLWDSTRDPSSGHFVVNGVVQPAGTVITISAAQLAQTSFVTGMVSNSLQIRAYDGIEWSAADNANWSPFTVAVTPYTAPTLTTSDVNTTPGQSLALSSLFSVNDPDGDTMTQYQLWDSTRDPSSGHFVVNGVAQAAGTVIDITAAQLAQTSFLTGTVGDALQIRAFDGISWSAPDTAAWAPFHVNV